MTPADLELSLHRRDALDANSGYSIEMRFSDPQSEADKLFISPVAVRFVPAELRQKALDAAAYGQYLAEQLFAGPDLRSFFEQALAATQAQDRSLRMRLFVGPSAPELHSLRWETLRAPGSDRPLFSDEHLPFSRYLSSLDWRPVKIRPRAELRALVVVANPTDLERYKLAPVDVEVELASIATGLGDIKHDDLAAPGKATLNGIVQRLREGYDILYLVAHGMLVDGEPWLFLENHEGAIKRVPGRELVTRIQELQERPRLVVLVSCQSAGEGTEPTTQDDGALAGLGPRLAAAGIPAVLAMQGNFTMKTAAGFMPLFFEELQCDGQIDRAVAVARGSVRERPDWWMPVLFMRLRSGRIWYTPGFGDEREGLKNWPALLRNIKKGRCTPILGPGLFEPMLGTPREIARRWAEIYGFPLHPQSCESLPQVAQYLSVQQDSMFVLDELEDHLKRELSRRFGEFMPEGWEYATLDELITSVGVRQQTAGEENPYRVLAQLDLPIYITTNPGNLLSEALKAAGKAPVVEICRWNEDVEMLPSVYDDEPDYRPSTARPLVYHLFGRLDEPDSVVLTEDDYFDYLIGVTSNKDLIPPVVRRALTDTALLFLGFNMDEWDFRVLFRSIMNREGRGRRKKYAHIAAQINPEEERHLEPEGARRYLESYFGDADISIFWGSVTDFAAELRRNWANASNPPTQLMEKLI